MDQINQVLQGLLNLLIQIANFIVGIFGAIENILRAQMTSFGVTRDIQTIVLVVVAVLFFIFVVRTFGGIFRLLLILFILLLAAHVLAPILMTRPGG